MMQHNRALRVLLSGTALVAVSFTAQAALAQSKIAVITPYLAQPGTQFYVEAF